MISECHRRSRALRDVDVKISIVGVQEFAKDMTEREPRVSILVLNVMLKVLTDEEPPSVADITQAISPSGDRTASGPRRLIEALESAGWVEMVNAPPTRYGARKLVVPTAKAKRVFAI